MLFLSRFKQEQLLEHLYDPIYIDDYFYCEFDRYCKRMAEKLMKSRSVGHESVCYDKFKNKTLPMVFVYQVDDNDDQHAFYFSSAFQKYIVSQFDSVKVGEYYGVLKSYIKSRQQYYTPTPHISSDFERRLYADIMDRVLAETEFVPADDLINAENEALMEQNLLERKLKRASYNCAVKDVKLHANKGILPSREEYLRPKFLEYLVSLRVYTPLNITSMFNDKDDTYCVSGCYIMMNTYNNKTFVGRADDIFTRVYSILRNDSCSACPLLSKDINSGDLVLVKFVPENTKMYKNCRKMQRDLILAYDCMGNNGYNRVFEQFKREAV